jgi:hypothetical protein
VDREGTTALTERGVCFGEEVIMSEWGVPDPHPRQDDFLHSFVLVTGRPIFDGWFNSFQLVVVRNVVPLLLPL